MDTMNMREATDEELAGWLAGYFSCPEAVETDHGLLLPESFSWRG